MIRGHHDARMEGEVAEDITETLQVLADGITNIQASLVKPKGRSPSLRDIDQKLNIIIEILKSWDTSSTACLNSLLQGDNVLQNQV